MTAGLAGCSSVSIFLCECPVRADGARVPVVKPTASCAASKVGSRPIPDLCSCTAAFTAMAVEWMVADITEPNSLCAEQSLAK